jgi:hypothetical protein
MWTGPIRHAAHPIHELAAREERMHGNDDDDARRG